MTAAAWWSALDDAAMLALGSAGLLRRAGKAVVGSVTRNGAAAEAEVDGFRVSVSEKGLALTRCTCPATGLCLHILAAVMALRDGSGDAATQVLPGNAVDEVAALPPTEIRTFAGRDLRDALGLATDTPLPEGDLTGPSVMLRPAGLSYPVTFLAGAGLRGAVWKGPDSRRRVAVTAAALILRAARGIPLPTLDDEDAASGTDPALLSMIADQIEAAVAPVLAGCGALAADRLLDLALSARTEAAPRLATTLRGLVQRAHDLDQRRAGAEAADFLIAAARAHALVHALQDPKADRGLAGQLRRDFLPVPGFSAVMLGARQWHGTTGARGLSLWGYDQTAGRWITATLARPEGLDPGFTPSAVYHGPLFGLARGAQSLGRTLTFDTPKLSDDGRLSADSLAHVEATLPQRLPEILDWSVLAGTLHAELGPFLQRETRTTAALLCPATIAGPSRADDGWELRLGDSRGTRLSVTLDGNGANALSGLERLPRGCRLLVEAREDTGRLRLTLASVIHLEGGMRVWCPSLDPLPAWLHAKAWPSRPEAASADRADPLAWLARDLLRAAVEVANGISVDPARLSRADALGAGLVRPLLTAPPTPAKALRLAWIAAELRWTSMT